MSCHHRSAPVIIDPPQVPLIPKQVPLIATPVAATSVLWLGALKATLAESSDHRRVQRESPAPDADFCFDLMFFVYIVYCSFLGVPCRWNSELRSNLGLLSVDLVIPRSDLAS